MLPEDKQLEIEIDRQLKKLPDLQAPASLAPRVMAIISARATAPWYQRSWSTWPATLRWSALTALVAIFGAICYAGWGISNNATPSLERFTGHLTGLGALWTVIDDLLASGVATIRSLGSGAIAGICAALVLSYAMCLALGAACYRLAYSTSKSFRL